MKELSEEELVGAFKLLDKLREAGDANMYDSPQYLTGEYGWVYPRSKRAMELWVLTFDRDTSPKARAEVAITIEEE